MRRANMTSLLKIRRSNALARRRVAPPFAFSDGIGMATVLMLPEEVSLTAPPLGTRSAGRIFLVVS